MYPEKILMDLYNLMGHSLIFEVMKTFQVFFFILFWWNHKHCKAWKFGRETIFYCVEGTILQNTSPQILRLKNLSLKENTLQLFFWNI